MARPLHSTSEVPDDSTYPEEPRIAAPNVGAAASGRERSSEETGDALTNVARRIGTALGRAVAASRETRDLARDRVRSAQDRVRSALENVREDAADRYREQRQVAAQRLRDARVALQRAPERYPLQLIA